MGIKKIEKLEEMISEYIHKDSKIVETNITNLTAPGDNYGSEIYKVDIKVNTSKEKLEDLNVVAKQIPESEFYQQIFNVQITFNVETEFYKSIVPTLHNFQKKNGMELLNAFPKFYGARTNLNGVNNIVDRDALIVLENLKVKGYINLERTVGFDLPTSKFVLNNLAKFHAVPLALKLKEPETFDKQIKALCTCFLKHPPEMNLGDEITELTKLLKGSKIGQAILERFKKSMKYMGALPTTFREPFATLVHRDFWVNNIMIKFDEENPTDIKIVDFQMYSYDSPATDLIFFLFTSVQTGILKENLDDLLKYYHEVFIETLSNLKCDTAPFSYDKLLEEIVACMKTELGKMIFMLVFIIRGPKAGHLNKADPQSIPKLTANHLTTEDTERLYWLLEEFEKKGVDQILIDDKCT